MNRGWLQQVGTMVCTILPDDRTIIPVSWIRGRKLCDGYDMVYCRQKPMIARLCMVSIGLYVL